MPAPGAVDLLLVDNDERITELIAWFLQERGYRVRRAASFAEARGLLAERRPDLLLSDVDLGAESGREELPRLAAEGILPPTLVVSGYLDAGVVSELSALEPVLGTLAKPFDLPVLAQRIAACLGSLGLEAPAGVGAARAPKEDPDENPAEDLDDGDWIEITSPGDEGAPRR